MRVPGSATYKPDALHDENSASTSKQTDSERRLGITTKMFEYEFDDDVFDDLDEADLAELERPAKRQRTLSTISRTIKIEDGVENADHLALANRILKENFGFQSFRHEQSKAIQAVLGRKNALVVFPTGAGKSLCYQIPALAFPELDKSDGSRTPAEAGLTIVVSPLIALMKDQVDALQKRGIAADSLDSTKTWEQSRVIYEKIRQSELRLLYCAPERLNNEGFVISIRDVPGGIRLLAVDEAHCVSEVRTAARHSNGEEELTLVTVGSFIQTRLPQGYLLLFLALLPMLPSNSSDPVARFAEEIKAERVICLTATATPKVADDICKAFNIGQSCVFRTAPYRPKYVSMRSDAVGLGPLLMRLVASNFLRRASMRPKQVVSTASWTSCSAAAREIAKMI